MPDSLSQRAHQIEDWAEQHMIDPQGVVYTMVDKSSGQPLDDAFFEGFDSYSPKGFTPAEFWSYENCGMTTGAYMQAMVYRYQVEQDPKALEIASRCFQGQKHIFEIGKQLEEGYFPKIYGNRYSHELSTDQYLYTVLAMDTFYPHATPQEQKEIDHILPAMIRFWVKRDYRYDYFNFVNMQWPLARFPSLLLLAYNHSGDEQFKKEYDRLLAAGVNKQPGEQQLYQKLAGLVEPVDYEKKNNAWLLSNLADCVTMDTMELDYLLRNAPESEWAETWKKSSLQMWNEAKVTLAPDGSVYTSVLMDMDTQEIRRPKVEKLDFDRFGSLLNDWDAGFHMHAATSGWSTMIARAGVHVAHHIQDNAEIISAVKHILTATKLENLTYYNEPERFLPEHRFLSNFISGDSLANYLWAYWQGRAEGFVQPD